MPKPLTPTSSQEIITISPPNARKPNYNDSGKSIRAKATIPFGKPATPSQSKTISHMSNYASTSNPITSTSNSTTLPTPKTFQPSIELKGKIVEHVRADKYLQQIGHVPTPGDSSKTINGDKKGKRKEREEEVERERKRLLGGEGDGSRERTTQRMMSTLGKGSNPITNSDLYTRTDHFVSSATGHQQSNSGGGSGGQGTYWEVRKAKMAEQAREGKSTILGGCIFYLNGSTGPKVSNLQLQNIITSNGGTFIPMQSGSCTHIIANGGLSGTKTQKWIDGQGSRGLAKRMKVVTTDWILDSVANGKRVSEAAYGVIKDPTQNSLLGVFGVKPKVYKKENGVSEKEDDTDIQVIP